MWVVVVIMLPVEWKPAPRGSKTCPNSCNNVGNCNADTGYCECPAGWKGTDCTTVQKRPCTHRSRMPPSPGDEPLSHIGPDLRDLDWLERGGTPSRCAGICDDDIGMCWCDRGPYGRIPAPSNSTPGTPPIRQGRPMVTAACQPKETEDGKSIDWGEQPYKNLFGPDGWCVAKEPQWTCPCIIDGVAGNTCDEVVEPFCVNQCSGHGTCNLGFCKCDPGWYGQDCSRKVAGQDMEPGRLGQQPWLAKVAKEPVAALVPPPAAMRKRPLIYIYDLEPLYNQKLLQYRIPSSWCVHRRYEKGNQTVHTDIWVYAVETLFHELLSQSEHRTFDPEEADYFYVPHYVTCYLFPVLGWADYPWFDVPGNGIRVNHGANIILQTKRWIEEKHPYWKRRGGRDHIWLFLHDEGACWAPNEVVPSIWLTHWGRLDKDHTSRTAYPGDNYNNEHKSFRQPDGWLKDIQGHDCYNPEKDLVIPSFKAPYHYKNSSLFTHPAKHRDILLYFKGDVGKRRLPGYSRGIRQRLYNMSVEQNWREKYNVYIGDSRDFGGDYSEQLSRSKFCLVAPGDGWSARMEDAVLHGCIPVIFQDNVHATFETLLDYSQFSIRLSEAQVNSTLDILLATPERKVRSLQAHLSRVWHRFRWMTGPALLNEAHRMVESAKQLRKSAAAEKQSQGRQTLQYMDDEELYDDDHDAAKAAPHEGEPDPDSSVMDAKSSQAASQNTPPASAAAAAAAAAGMLDKGTWTEAGGGQVTSSINQVHNPEIDLGRLIKHPTARLPRPFRGDPAVDDAFSTIMQWLHSRIPHTR